MTRKQAIEEIIDTFTDEYADEIIKALGQESTTKNDSHILEDIKNEILEQYWGDGRKEYFDDKYSIEYIDGALEAADYIIKMIDKHKAGKWGISEWQTEKR